MRNKLLFLVFPAIIVHSACGKHSVFPFSAKKSTKTPIVQSVSNSRSFSSVPEEPSWKSVKGVYHTVMPGETFWRICKTYDVDMQHVAEINNIIDISKIPAGLRVFIPNATRVLKIDTERVFGLEDRQKISIQKGKFIWPVRGIITSQFGVRDNRMHNGIDIQAKKGQIVNAAHEGKVVYAGSLRGYGKIVVIRHTGDYSTVYAHLGKISVKEGQAITKSKIIGKVGETGNASGAHLHFEVRLRGQPRNPLFYLP